MLQKAVMLIYIRQYLRLGILYAQNKGRKKLAENGPALVLQVSFDFTQQVSEKKKSFLSTLDSSLFCRRYFCQ